MYIEQCLAAFFICLASQRIIHKICENTNWVEQIPVSEFVNAVIELEYGVEDNIWASEGRSSRRQERIA